MNGSALFIKNFIVVRCEVSGYEYSSTIHEQFHENFMNIVP